MNHPAHDASPDDRGALACLSALADGRADACDEALARWASDPEARAAWHRYQLIGDALRSDDLAADPGHDAAFLARFSARLAEEPTIVAPMPRPSSTGSMTLSRRWSVAAAAAGVLVVGGVVASLRGPGDAGVAVAGGGPGGNSLVPLGAKPGATADDLPIRTLDGTMIRDARLDAYLWAHRGHGAVSGRLQSVVLER